MNAPVSKTWDWSDISPLVPTHCVLIGDFNVDLVKDGERANKLLERMDGHSLAPLVPDENTSLRADRTIDYAMAVGVEVSIQTYEGSTSSDHKPILGVLTMDEVSMSEGSRTVWPVFSLVLSYMSRIWEQHGGVENHTRGFTKNSLRSSHSWNLDVDSTSP